MELVNWSLNYSEFSSWLIRYEIESFLCFGIIRYHYSNQKTEPFEWAYILMSFWRLNLLFREVKSNLIKFCALDSILSRWCNTICQITWDAGGIDVNTFLFFNHTCFAIIYSFSFDFSFLFKEFNQFYQLIWCLWFFNLSFLSFYLSCSVIKCEFHNSLTGFRVFFPLTPYCFVSPWIDKTLCEALYVLSSLDIFKFHLTSLIDDKKKALNFQILLIHVLFVSHKHLNIK